MNQYDVIVVGAGPAGIMACYELYLKKPELKVLLVDKGHDVMYRHCPIKDKKIKRCPEIKEEQPGCLPACWAFFKISIGHPCSPPVARCGNGTMSNSRLLCAKSRNQGTAHKTA